MGKILKEPLRERYAEFAKSRPHTETAKRTGMKVQKLRTFVSQGILKDDDCVVLAEYLLRETGENYLPTVARRQKDGKTIYTRLGGELIKLGEDLLDPDYPVDLKRIKFMSLLDAYLEARPRYEALFKELENEISKISS